jgi:hypothetical protein
VKLKPFRLQPARDLAQRRILIPMVPDVAYRELAGLRASIRIAPGRLEIACTDAEDLLRQLMELAQAIANDFGKFSAVVGRARKTYSPLCWLDRQVSVERDRVP